MFNDINSFRKTLLKISINNEYEIMAKELIILIFNKCWYDGIGRHNGLKIRGYYIVRVQVSLPAPFIIIKE